VRKLIVIIAGCIAAGGAWAQPSLSDQINAVGAAQEQHEAAERAAQQAYERRMAEQQRAATAAAERRQAEESALKRQKLDDALLDKKRDQNYEDQLRELEVQKRALAVEAEKARVTRANEYIDQELKEKAASTDVIKSQADATRNISEGTKTLLEKTGEAEVKSQSGLFK
jgi:hypothetical protein